MKVSKKENVRYNKRSVNYSQSKAGISKAQFKQNGINYKAAERMKINTLALSRMSKTRKHKLLKTLKIEQPDIKRQEELLNSHNPVADRSVSYSDQECRPEFMTEKNIFSGYEASLDSQAIFETESGVSYRDAVSAEIHSSLKSESTNITGAAGQKMSATPYDSKGFESVMTSISSGAKTTSVATSAVTTVSSANPAGAAVNAAKSYMKLVERVTESIRQDEMNYHANHRFAAQMLDNASEKFMEAPEYKGIRKAGIIGAGVGLVDAAKVTVMLSTLISSVVSALVSVFTPLLVVILAVSVVITIITSLFGSESEKSANYYFSSQGFIWPLPEAYQTISSPFGPRPAPTPGATTYHIGIDIPAPIGTPIFASRAGTVLVAGNDTAMGNYIIIDHHDGSQTYYCHSSRLIASTGDEVMQGETIALVGSTGYSTGAHLDFKIKINGELVNPVEWIGKSLAPEIRGDTNRDKIFNYLIDSGFTKAGAAGAIACIEGESGFEPALEEYGVTNGGYGICQWTGERRTRIENYAASKNASVSSLDLQLEFLIWELHNYYPGVWQYETSVTSPEDGGEYWLLNFEIPASVLFYGPTVRQNTINKIRGKSRTYYDAYN